MKNKKLFIAAIALCTILLVAIYVKKDEFNVVFFDVGQGDSIFINCPNDYQILIDGGPDNTVVEKIGKYMPFYDRTIELVILTHPDGDHVTGLVEVLDRYKVSSVIYTDVESQNSAYAKFRDLIEDNYITEQIAQAGQTYIITESIILNVVYPFDNYQNEVVDDVNSTSVVTRLVVGTTGFLFTGDASVDEESEIIDSGLDISADVLKVGHHGSNTSTSEGFITAVDPDYAVIQVGTDNHFGHPKFSVLRLLENNGLEIFRTDINGDVVMKIIDGKLEILPEKW